jgi:Flp pilus assembly protein TadD
VDGAIACYQKALALDPKYAKNHYNLGNALRAKGDLDGAIASHQKALELDPEYAQAHNNLGVALYAKHDLDGAIACYHKALGLDPKLAPAHSNLGNALRQKHDLDGAIACYKRSLELDPEDATAHYNLGIALHAKGDLDGAIACYKKALDLDPKFAEAHCNLGDVLRQQGRFAEAVASLRRGHELGSKRSGWRYPSAQWVRDAERMLVLDKKLPAILTGEATPANPAEAVVLASMCQLPYQKRYAASNRLYADAFAAQPELADDLKAAYRYNAACAASLAAAGQGQNPDKLNDKGRARLRRQVLDWLRADLALRREQVEKGPPHERANAQSKLKYWQQDANLASVRDPQALDRLPEDERTAWRALWRDVDELAKRVAK